MNSVEKELMNIPYKELIVMFFVLACILITAPNGVAYTEAVEISLYFGFLSGS